MRDLLAHGGFRLRTATRADCARYAGRSRGTVSYNADVAHCFRCGWSANRFALACDLGLARKARAGLRAKARREFQRRAKSEREIRAFARWRDERLREVADRYYALTPLSIDVAKYLWKPTD